MLGILSFLSGFTLGTVVSWDGWDGTIKITFPKQYAFVATQWNKLFNKQPQA